jgi:GT2 family glycosyltransferase
VKALIITINFRGARDTLEFLESVKRLENFEQTSVLIVDNASADGSFETITKAIGHMPNCRCLVAPKNLGYFGAAKWALDIWQVDAPIPDWVIVCNNDILFPDPDFLTNLFAQPAEVGVIAPRIVSMRNDHEQNPFMVSRPGRLGLLKIRFWFSRFALCRLQTELSGPLRSFTRFFRPRNARHLERQDIYAPHGAFIIFSLAFFERGGYIDDGAFLYGEEIGAAEAAARVGLRVVFEPLLKIFHNEHRSTGHKLSRATYGYKRDALRYLRERYWQDIG